MEILNEDASKKIGKPCGKYFTIDFNDDTYMDSEDLIVNEISKNLQKIIDSKVKHDEEILVVGLGNQFVTPDALGFKVVSEIDVTRHILKYAPECISKFARPVSAISPGVMGTTGIETYEIIKSVVDSTKPKLIIAIDSLATCELSRIGKSIQISDTGIIPGSGVKNRQMELSQSTLGIPVIAIGVPMVVDLDTIMNENQHHTKIAEENSSQDFKFEKNENRKVVSYNMMVTPKEIDEIVEETKELIARSINASICTTI